MIRSEDVLLIHSALIDMYGGAHGVRDVGLLESALNRPYSTFDQQELYPSLINKCSALIESILINHPFVDGNKRTGFSLIALMLKKENYIITASENDIYDFIISIASGKRQYDEIVTWLEMNTGLNN